MKQPLLHKLDQLSTERWARRGVRMLLRAAWLSVCIWCIALGGHMLWGWPLRANIVGAAALALIGGAVLLLLRPRLAARTAANRLDRRFHLDEQLATAVEVAATNPPPGSIAARLVMESSHTAELLHRRIARRQRPPWQDALTLVALSLVAIGLWVISGVGFPDLGGRPLPLPPLASAQDPAQQLPQEPQAPDQSGQSSQIGPGDTGQPGQSGAAAQNGATGDPQVIQALADALRDQGATRPAAQALDRGDLAGAAQQLRELADQAGQLSQSSRDDLANSLEDAAQQIEGSDPQLAGQLEQSADGLRQGQQDAAEALDDLARAIEQLPQSQPNQQAGQDGQPAPGEQAGQDGQAGQDSQAGPAGEQGQGEQQGQGQGNGTGAGSGSGGEQRQAQPNDRLGVEGQAVPLESSGEGDTPAQSSDDKPPIPSGAAGNGGFTQGGTSSSERVQVGDDPQRVPIDERDVVQGYFQPQN
ncbi:MAG: hypothetical protein ABIV47_08205 [Roseiflexaceae bacterium]